jgi:hypothetical protein
VRRLPEPATDRVDHFGRLLRYVVRVKDGVNVSLAFVAVGAAALLLRTATRGLRLPTREPRQERAYEAPRTVGSVPAHAVRPVPRHRDAPLEGALRDAVDSRRCVSRLTVCSAI